MVGDFLTWCQSQAGRQSLTECHVGSVYPPWCQRPVSPIRGLSRYHSAAKYWCNASTGCWTEAVWTDWQTRWQCPSWGSVVNPPQTHPCFLLIRIQLCWTCEQEGTTAHIWAKCDRNVYKLLIHQERSHSLTLIFLLTINHSYLLLNHVEMKTTDEQISAGVTHLFLSLKELPDRWKRRRQ